MLLFLEEQQKIVERFLDKGRQVYIEGKLQTRKYTDKDGNERRKTEILSNQVVFLSTKSWVTLHIVDLVQIVDSPLHLMILVMMMVIFLLIINKIKPMILQLL